MTDGIAQMQLHNFGGNLGLYGRAPVVYSKPLAVQYAANSTMVGVGITMEGINQNVFVYDALLDAAWRAPTAQVPVEDFTTQWVTSRYGAHVNGAVDAWQTLLVNRPFG